MSRILTPNKYTVVVVNDEPGSGGANHNYDITTSVNEAPAFYKKLLNVQFQNGPIQETGVNGVMNEDLIKIVIDRMQDFQSGKFACRENALALTKLEEALMWLEKRTSDRELRGVEGTHNV